MAALASTLMVAVTDRVALVKISGRASFTCSVNFKTLVYGLRDRGYRRFLLDVTECLIMDSTFLGVLAGFGLKLGELPGESTSVCLLNANERVRDLLENLGVSHLFQMLEGEDPLSAKCQAIEPSGAGPTRLETSRTCLEAHETLMAINPDNIPKFKDVTKFMAEELNKLETRKG